MSNSGQEKVLSPSGCPGDVLATEDCTELTSDFGVTRANVPCLSNIYQVTNNLLLFLEETVFAQVA